MHTNKIRRALNFVYASPVISWSTFILNTILQDTINEINNMCNFMTKLSTVSINKFWMTKKTCKFNIKFLTNYSYIQILTKIRRNYLRLTLIIKELTCCCIQAIKT
ncbi:hypothetical protein FWK35_00010571 [Aphis craccivora]|uniref:Uncharacterized protein n=1 Tax=Aphis craccivora TaxID=307492 RepID=A0A6G0Z901_APHCR|nr:hypothetical protein FWK35_00010571 [Aphis craccivora]